MAWAIVLGLLLVGLGLIGVVRAERQAYREACYRRRRRRSAAIKASASQRHRHSRRKPDWVRLTVIRMAAESPGAGCRRLELAFNQRHAEQGMSIGKTFVSEVIKRHRHRAVQARPRRSPAPCPIRAVWALDITEHRLDPARPQPIVGLLDHGSRALLSLEALRDKSSITLLRVMLTAVEQYGRPRALRTDNEVIFTSRLFRFGLRWLGIRHQRTALHSPWQNGRVERVFGTLKPLLRLFAPGDMIELKAVLRTLGRTYNHLRPHQSLDGQTPAQVWQHGEDERKRRR